MPRGLKRSNLSNHVIKATGMCLCWNNPTDKQHMELYVINILSKSKNSREFIQQFEIPGVVRGIFQKNILKGMDKCEKVKK